MSDSLLNRSNGEGGSIRPLSDRRYRRLFSAQVIALAGTGLTTIALALLAYDLAGGNAGVVLGTALAIKMVAYVGIAPVVGAYADRLPRRQVLIGLDIARAVFVGCLPFVTEIWQIYLLIFLLNACSAGFTPTFQATIPDVLPDDGRYTRALSLSRLAYDLENLLSPVLAAAALLVLSYHLLFAVNALAFLVSAALVFSVQLPAAQPREQETGVWRNLSFGSRQYLSTPRLRGLLALSMATAAAGAMVIVNTVIYVRDDLGGGDTATALAFAAFGGGSMLVALMLPRWLDRYPDRPFMLTGGLLLAVGLAAGQLGPGMTGLLLIWFVLGVGSSLVQTPAGRLLKRSAHAADRPAIFAAQFALSHACWLLAYPLAGWVGSSGLSPAFLLLSLLALVSTALAAWLWPGKETAEVRHQHAELVHSHPHRHDEHHQHAHDGVEASSSPGTTHEHEHRHDAITHSHIYIIDSHHAVWPVR